MGMVRVHGRPHSLAHDRLDDLPSINCNRYPGHGHGCKRRVGRVLRGSDRGDDWNEGGKSEGAAVVGGMVAEVRLYGDVVLRLLSLDADAYSGPHLPGYTDAPGASGPAAAAASSSFGIERFDHIVGNVWELLPTIKRLQSQLGFHEFAEFTAADVGTIDSGLNSMVRARGLANGLTPHPVVPRGARSTPRAPSHATC